MRKFRQSSASPSFVPEIRKCEFYLSQRYRLRKMVLAASVCNSYGNITALQVWSRAYLWTFAYEGIEKHIQKFHANSFSQMRKSRMPIFKVHGTMFNGGDNSGVLEESINPQAKAEWWHIKTQVEAAKANKKIARVKVRWKQLSRFQLMQQPEIKYYQTATLIYGC